MATQPHPNPRAQVLLERADNDIREIMTSLHQVEQTDHFRMQEALFKDAFLPLFANEKVADPRITMGFYVDMIGNAFRSVDVIDEAGNLVFTVPPVFNRETLRTAMAGGRTSFREILANHRLMAFNSPAAAEGYMVEAVSKKALLQYDTEEGRKEAAQWNAIFKRYGRKPPFDIPEVNAVEGTPTQVASQPKSFADNGFDID